MTKTQIAKGLFVASGSLVWAFVALSLWLYYDYAPTAIALTFALVFAVLSALTWKVHPHFAHLVPVWGETLRIQRIRARRRANKWLRDVGLLPKSDATSYCSTFTNPRRGNPTLTLSGIDAIADADLEKQAVKRLGNYEATEVSLRREGKKVVVTWIRESPLDQPFSLQSLPPVDAGSMGVGCLRNGLGEVESLDFFETSGAVVSGLPGSGKSVSLAVPLKALDEDASAEVIILDGKGGSDWEGFKNYHDVSANLPKAEQVLSQVRDEMNRRYRAKIGKFWNLPADNRPPFIVVAIDECQTLFEASADKEEKALKASLSSLATDIVARGRDAGVCVIFATQRMTTDSIPSNARARCALNIAFRLRDLDSVKAGLGTQTIGAEACPTRIPVERRGGAVIEKNGERKHYRFACYEGGSPCPLRGDSPALGVRSLSRRRVGAHPQ